MEVLAVIPARAGSKSVKNKNIRIVNGKPLLAHSVAHALAAKTVNRVILSTDSEEYAAIGKSFGAEVPFLRPAEYSGDLSTDLEVFEHALKWLKENENYIPDIVVQLRPTYPVRNPEDIDEMVNILWENPDADSVRSMAPAKEVAYKMWRKKSSVSKNSERVFSAEPLLKDIPEAYNMPRQELPVIYYQNACIDVFRTDTVTKKHSMTGDFILGYEMDENFDIDTEEELVRAGLFAGGKRLVIDIDGVIAELREDHDYSKVGPRTEVIRNINRLYDAGNEIILLTARGYKTGKDWKQLTLESLEKWGVKYHELHFGKPNADYYIDDKMMPLSFLENL